MDKAQKILWNILAIITSGANIVLFIRDIVRDKVDWTMWFCPLMLFVFFMSFYQINKELKEE